MYNKNLVIKAEDLDEVDSHYAEDVESKQAAEYFMYCKANGIDYVPVRTALERLGFMFDSLNDLEPRIEKLEIEKRKALLPYGDRWHIDETIESAKKLNETTELKIRYVENMTAEILKPIREGLRWLSIAMVLFGISQIIMWFVK